MKIGVIQATSQKDKNLLLYNSVKRSVADKGYEVINFGIEPDEIENYSYVEIAVWISILLESKAIDFIVTGCSSGQGMMLACNSLPGVLCGYIQNPSDAYLFGRINNGNAVSFPMGLNFGWAGELNLKCTLEQLFKEPFGTGYPVEDAERKRKDTTLMKSINQLTKRSLAEVLTQLDPDWLRGILKRERIYNYVMAEGKDEEIKALIHLIFDINIIKESLL